MLFEVDIEELCLYKIIAVSFFLGMAVASMPIVLLCLSSIVEVVMAQNRMVGLSEFLCLCHRINL